MKEKQTVSEKIVVIDIKLTRKLVVVLSCILTLAALLTYLTLTGESAVASGETAPSQSIGMRQFYLTGSVYPGNAAKTACAAGYHMASMWEMVDPSNLKYNTSLGYTLDDSGQGPPTAIPGWVRTGYNAVWANITGRANCDNWTDNEPGHYGTRALLPPDWTVEAYQNLDVWYVETSDCSIVRSVWCVED